MITQIDAQIQPEEIDGWTCAKLTGIYTVTRMDGSKREVDRDGLIALLQKEPKPQAADACPGCGESGGVIQETGEGFTRFCFRGCGPYRFEDPQAE